MKGVVVEFDKNKRFGVIRSEHHEEIHFNISQVLGTQYPLIGQHVEFKTKTTPKGLSAIDIVPGKMNQSAFNYFGIRAAVTVLAITSFLYFTKASGTGKTGLFIAYFIAINLTTMGFFYYDKWKAVSARRVPENILLGLSLLGGSLAAAISMKLFQHKTRKDWFKTKFALIVAVHGCIVLATVK